MRTFLFFLCVLSQAVFGQMTGPELLKKAIEFHDPNGNWSTFSGELKIQLDMPDGTQRMSSVGIDLNKSWFWLNEKKDVETTRIIDNEKCTIFLNGKSEFSESDRDKYKLSCERSKMMRNYYTYLYGLPMKLSDDGTIIHEKVETRDFKGTSYLVLKVTYDEAVGKDTWYFYFDRGTYEMKLYQFYHDEEKNDGEFILLSDIVEYNDIKIPKERKWYTNGDEKFLGTDLLLSCSEL